MTWKEIAGWTVSALAGALLVWFVALVFEPVGTFFTNFINFVLGREPAYAHAISTSVPHCVTGFVPRLLAREGEQLSVELASGADRTYICDNNKVRASQSDFARKLSDAYPGCLTYSELPGAKLALNERSLAVCRASYRVTDGRAGSAGYEQGVNLCLGQVGRTARRPQGGGARFPRSCTDDELHAHGFLVR